MLHREMRRGSTIPGYKPAEPSFLSTCAKTSALLKFLVARVGGAEVDEYHRYVGDENSLLAQYLASVENHLYDLLSVYENAFHENYRRRSEDIILQSTSFTDVRAETWANGVSTISLGAVLAIEDAAQALVSSHETPLARNLLRQDEAVRCRETFERYDAFRFFNYLPMISEVSDESDPEDFCSHLFRSRSLSIFRQELGDLLADVSLMWLLCHEDAHSYLGHIDFLEKNGMTESLGAAEGPNRTVFDELLGEYSDARAITARRAMEFEADSNAGARIADHIIDSEFFELNPVLYASVDQVRNELKKVEEELGTFSEKLLRFIVVTRLAVSGAALAIAVLHRGVQKRNSDMRFYPSYSARLLNVTVAIIARAHKAVSINPHYDLELPSIWELFTIARLYIEDIRAIHKTVLENNAGLQDQDMDNEENKRVLNEFASENFAPQFALALVWALYRDDHFLPDSVEEHGDTLLTFLREHAESSLFAAQEFREYYLARHPRRKREIEEGIEVNEAMAEFVLAKLDVYGDLYSDD